MTVIHKCAVYLEGGQVVEFRATAFTIGIGEDGSIESYHIETLPEDNVSTLVFNPKKIAGITTKVIEPEGKPELPDDTSKRTS